MYWDYIWWIIGVFDRKTIAVDVVFWKLSLNGRKWGLSLSSSLLEFVIWVKRCTAFTCEVNTSGGHHTCRLLGSLVVHWNVKVLRLSQGSKNWGDLTSFTCSALVPTVTQNTKTWLLLISPLCFSFSLFSSPSDFCLYANQVLFN